MAEQCACKSNTTRNQEQVGESRVDVETGYEEEEEESLESEIPTVETKMKNPMSRAEQE